MTTQIEELVERSMNRPVPYDGLSNRKGVSKVDRESESEKYADAKKKSHWLQRANERNAEEVDDITD